MCNKATSNITSTSARVKQMSVLEHSLDHYSQKALDYTSGFSLISAQAFRHNQLLVCQKTHNESTLKDYAVYKSNNVFFYFLYLTFIIILFLYMLKCFQWFSEYCGAKRSLGIKPSLYFSVFR